MFEKIVENLTVIFKANETKAFAKNSAENIAVFCLTGDLVSGVKEAFETVQYIWGIKDILFWGRIKKWLENTYDPPEMEVKLAAKFTEDEEKYKEYTKRQLQYIAQIDEDKKIILRKRLLQLIFI